jgi:hypothetical protein
LLDIPEINTTEPWWDQQVIKSATLKDDLFFATSAWHLMAFDGTWCLFFNEDMMGNYGLSTPYELVDSGSWTVSKLDEYTKAVTSLNGDNDFSWSVNGNSIYGISAHVNMVQKFILGTGEKFVDLNNDGYPEFQADNERFYSIISALSKIFKDKEGQTIKASTEDFDAAAGGYMYIFTSNRSLFLTGEIKAAQLMRDMENSFGVLPYPKYDENQKQYYSSTVKQMFVMLIPVTNPDPSIAGTIADAMSYDSYSYILPSYFDVVVSQKGLRNEDSIRMLNIIRDTRGIDLGDVYGWSASLASSIADKVFLGDDAVVSDVAAQKTSIEASIEEMLQKFAELK